MKVHDNQQQQHSEWQCVKCVYVLSFKKWSKAVGEASQNEFSEASLSSLWQRGSPSDLESVPQALLHPKSIFISVVTAVPLSEKGVQTALLPWLETFRIHGPPCDLRLAHIYQSASKHSTLSVLVMDRPHLKSKTRRNEVKQRHASAFTSVAGCFFCLFFQHWKE